MNCIISTIKSNYSNTAFRLVVLLPLLIGSSVSSGCRTTQTAQFDPHGESDLDDAQFRDVKLTNGVQRHHLVASGSTLRLGVGDALEIENLVRNL